MASKKRGTVWCDRTLVRMPLRYAICFTEAAYHVELRRLRVPRDEWDKYLPSKSSGAATHYYENKEGGICCIVVIAPQDKYSVAQMHAMLCHEAVHVWQEAKRQLGEKYPSSEFEAYAIQNISEEFMTEWDKYHGKVKRRSRSL